MAICERVYDAYGKGKADDGAARTSYAGHGDETGTDDYLLGHRLYDAALRRFLAPDPLSPFDRGGVHRYAYCGGDPIGRIDPDGHTWFAWIVQTLERIELTATTYRGSSGAEGVFVTPTLRTAANVHSPSTNLWTSVMSRASVQRFGAELTRYGDTVMPLTGPGAETTAVLERPGVLGIVWPRKSDTGSATLFTQDQRTIHVLQGPRAFTNDPRRAGPALGGSVFPQWMEKTNGKGVHFSTSTTVNLQYLPLLKRYIDRKHAGQKVTVLAGAHGVPHGRHWNDGRRSYLEESFYQSTAKRVGALDWHVDMKNYADIDAETFSSMLAEGEGVFVHVTCFGAADELFMKAFNIRDVTVRSLIPF